MDRYLNLVRLPLNDSDAVGPKGFQAMLLGPGNNEQVTHFFSKVLSCSSQPPQFQSTARLPVLKLHPRIATLPAPTSKVQHV